MQHLVAAVGRWDPAALAPADDDQLTLLLDDAGCAEAFTALAAALSSATHLWTGPAGVVRVEGGLPIPGGRGA